MTHMLHNSPHLPEGECFSKKFQRLRCGEGSEWLTWGTKKKVQLHSTAQDDPWPQAAHPQSTRPLQSGLCFSPTHSSLLDSMQMDSGGVNLLTSKKDKLKSRQRLRVKFYDTFLYISPKFWYTSYPGRL